jgi:hypothetical protein
MGTPRKAIAHGTINGYQQHMYYGHPRQWKAGTLERCEPCTKAWRERPRKDREYKKPVARPMRHGTRKGYMRHWRIGDVAAWKEGSIPRCEPCTKANSKHSKAQRNSAETYRRSHAANFRARTRALNKLRLRHPDEYETIFTEELRKVREEENGREESASRN